MADVENDKTQDTTSQETNSDADKRLANMVNSAVTAHLKRHMSKFESLLEEKLGGIEKISSTKQSTKTDEDKQSDVEDKVSKKDFDKLRAELDQERLKARESEVFTDIKAKLNGKVRPEAMEMSVKLLKADGKVHVTKKGVVFKHDGEEYEDIEEGLQAWLNSKETQLLRPAPSQSGAKAKTPFKAPARQSASAGTNKPADPMQKTIDAFQKLGLKL